MSKPATTVRGAFVTALAVATLGAAVAPRPAAAQSYGYAPPSYSDVCRSDRTNRTALGTLLGAGVGVALGSQVAANHHRTDGSIVGGLLGALGGGMVGHGTAPCVADQAAYAAPPPPAPAPPRAYAPPPQPLAPAYYEGRHDDEDEDDDGGRWAYGDRGGRFRIADRPAGPDGCTLVESPIYMPDGHVQKRLVRVCMDSAGRYQVVN
jgi:hypothetical protein